MKKSDDKGNLLYDIRNGKNFVNYPALFGVTWEEWFNTLKEIEYGQENNQHRWSDLWGEGTRPTHPEKDDYKRGQGQDQVYKKGET